MQDTKVTSLLVERLEYIPADSIWAHRASGVRLSLIRMIESIEAGLATDAQKAEELCNLGFQILEQAAKEKS